MIAADGYFLLLVIQLITFEIFRVAHGVRGAWSGALSDLAILTTSWASLRYLRIVEQRYIVGAFQTQMQKTWAISFSPLDERAERQVLLTAGRLRRIMWIIGGYHLVLSVTLLLVLPLYRVSTAELSPDYLESGFGFLVPLPAMLDDVANTKASIVMVGNLYAELCIEVLWRLCSLTWMATELCLGPWIFRDSSGNASGTHEIDYGPSDGLLDDPRDSWTRIGILLGYGTLSLVVIRVAWWAISPNDEHPDYKVLHSPINWLILFMIVIGTIVAGACYVVAILSLIKGFWERRPPAAAVGQ